MLALIVSYIVAGAVKRRRRASRTSDAMAKHKGQVRCVASQGVGAGVRMAGVRLRGGCSSALSQLACRPPSPATHPCTTLCVRPPPPPTPMHSLQVVPSPPSPSVSSREAARGMASAPAIVIEAPEPRLHHGVPHASADAPVHHHHHYPHHHGTHPDPHAHHHVLNPEGQARGWAGDHHPHPGRPGEGVEPVGATARRPSRDLSGHPVPGPAPHLDAAPAPKEHHVQSAEHTVVVVPPLPGTEVTPGAPLPGVVTPGPEPGAASPATVV